MLTLFRLIDQLAGRILIDGVDIASLGIDALRSQLAIIPQVPSLLVGMSCSSGQYLTKAQNVSWHLLVAVVADFHGSA